MQNLTIKNNISFKQLKPIPKKAYSMTDNAIMYAKPSLESICQEYDLEVIAKKGFLTNIKSLIFFITNKGQNVGDWFSLSIDPKELMPKDNPRYMQIDKFTPENIITGALMAKHNLRKYNWNLSKPKGPVDLVLLSKLFKKNNFDK